MHTEKMKHCQTISLNIVDEYVDYVEWNKMFCYMCDIIKF